MASKYRYEAMDLTSKIVFGFGNKNSSEIAKYMKIQAGPRCIQCNCYVDRTIRVFIRKNHKIFGPQEYCQECMKINDERFDKFWKEQQNGKRIAIRLKSDREKEKEQLQKEMDIYRRKEV